MYVYVCLILAIAWVNIIKGSTKFLSLLAQYAFLLHVAIYMYMYMYIHVQYVVLGLPYSASFCIYKIMLVHVHVHVHTLCLEYRVSWVRVPPEAVFSLPWVCCVALPCLFV